MNTKSQWCITIALLVGGAIEAKLGNRCRNDKDCRRYDEVCRPSKQQGGAKICVHRSKVSKKG